MQQNLTPYWSPPVCLDKCLNDPGLHIFKWPVIVCEIPAVKCTYAADVGIKSQSVGVYVLTQVGES